MRIRRNLGLALAVVVVSGAVGFAAADEARTTVVPEWHAKVDPWVLSTAAGAGETEFLVFLAEQADLRGADLLVTKEARGAFVFQRLRATADGTQGPLLEMLEARGAEHQPFWVANMIKVRGGLALVEELALRDDVAHVYANPVVRLEEPVAEEERAPEAVEPGVTKIRAPEVWAAGFTGQTVVVGGQDTGYDWDHPALVGKYRGWNGSSANHNYNWHDAIHSGGGVCGPDSPVPCDDTNHGTHTMGTMVGDDGAGNQVGVAPGARWIGCRNMDQGFGTPATYTECFQWFIAPTDLNGQNPDPTKAPHVINNSWGCPPSEGCTDPNVLKAVVDNTRAAGIMVVVSAGNSGSACSTVNTPAAIYQSSFSVGATNVSDAIASFSSRGPVTIDGSGRLKPNVSAPGVSVRSCVPGTGYASMSGTSMAGPHVAGAVALLLSAAPSLKGQVPVLETTMQDTAFDLPTTQNCGGIPPGQVPNNTFGYGRIDAFEAVRSRSADLTLTSTPWPWLIRTGRSLQFTLTVANAGPGTATGTSVMQNMPATVFNPLFIIAVPSQGSCQMQGANIVCALGSIPSGASATITVTALVANGGIAVSVPMTDANELDLTPAGNSVTLRVRGVGCSPQGICK